MSWDLWDRWNPEHSPGAAQVLRLEARPTPVRRLLPQRWALRSPISKSFLHEVGQNERLDQQVISNTE